MIYRHRMLISRLLVGPALAIVAGTTQLSAQGASADAAPEANAAMMATTFHACFVPDVGAMYLIKLPGLPTQCLTPNHEEITWIYAHRIAGGHRDHRHTGGDSLARSGARARGGEAVGLSKQPETIGHRVQDVCERVQRREVAA